MNLTFSVIVLKTLFITLATMLVLPLFSTINVTQAILTGLAMSFITYVGDLLLLPRVNIYAATAVDVVVIALVLWAGATFWDRIGLTIPESLLLISIISFGEWFLHRYLRVNVNARSE